MLTFDDNSHAYRWKGVIVPSVTQIISPLSDFSMVREDVMQAAQQFGTFVHKTCELYDLGQLDEAELDPQLQPYLTGWKKFCKDSGAIWSEVEKSEYHASHGYAGTSDRKGVAFDSPAVVDIKTSAVVSPAVGLQLAAYKNLGFTATLPKTRRFAVQLRDDGTYRAPEFKESSDWPTFLSMLNVRNWAAQHSITPNF
jgi:hypothetical protein